MTEEGEPVKVYRLMWKSLLNPMRSVKHLDGDPGLIDMVDKTPERGLEMTPGLSALESGRAIEPEHLPTKLMIKNGKIAVTDFDGYWGLIFISPRFKAIIEELEPGVHQFAPVQLVDRRKQPMADHWIWIICQSLDTIDAEASNFELRHECRYKRRGEDVRPLIFSKSKIGHHHFWREKFMMPGHYVMLSEQAAKMMQAAGLTAVQYTEYEVQ
jgi:hypothetical protein